MDIKRKLTSRKFWITVAAFVYQVIYSTQWADTTVGTIVGVVMSAAIALGYVIGESVIDASSIRNVENYVENVESEE